MKILIAPDKFKGSLSSERVASAIQRGIHEYRSDIMCKLIPLADGGDGTSTVLTESSGGEFHSVRVDDPIGRPTESRYGTDKRKSKAFIEMASASGLSLLASTERNPVYTSSRGTGQLMCDAIARNVNTIFLGVGGTATNDGGMGIADAFGIKFLDAFGRPLAPIGKNLCEVSTINVQHMNPHIADVAIRVLNDVKNPLFGPQGAAYVFAEQKGAAPEDLKILDDGLKHFASILEDQFQQPVNFKGAGAGGGVGAVLKTLFHATFESGISFIMNYLNVEDHIITSDVVITGEGSIDLQTLEGKVVSGVAAFCRKHHKPLFVMAGRNQLSEIETRRLGIQKVFTLENPADPSDTINNAYEILTSCARTHAVEFLSA